MQKTSVFQTVLTNDGNSGIISLWGWYRKEVGMSAIKKFEYGTDEWNALAKLAKVLTEKSPTM